MIKFISGWLAKLGQKFVQPETKGGFQLRPNYGQGPFSKYFKQFVPRKHEATFFEFLRESIPIIDAAINRLISLDGHVVVKGKSEALVEEVREWMDSVRVNDVQRGMQAFHQSLSNEAFEQGFGLGEFVANDKRNDIVHLRTADSKFIKFRRADDSLEILQKSDDDHDYRPLNTESMIYFSINNENQNPYGTPLMRSCEFVSKVLVTIQNSTLNVWERFGDPSFNIIYKTSKKDGTDHAARRRQIEEEFNTAIRAKREGKSADFIRAIDKDSDITIQVIGHDNQVLEMQVPARHMLEQIIAKTGLPPWMLGLHWTTTERLSNAEAEMLLGDVATRQSAKMPMFTNLVATMLKLRGRRWKTGDWKLEWANVNLHDVVAQAQARFLNAQADMYYLQNAQAAGIEITREDLSIGKSPPAPLFQRGERTIPNVFQKGGGSIDPVFQGVGREFLLRRLEKEKANGLLLHSCKEIYRTFEWPELDRLETEYEKLLKDKWVELLVEVKAALGLGIPKAVKGPEDPEAFEFAPEQRARVSQLLQNWIDMFSPDLDESPVSWFYGQALSLGYFMAADMAGKAQPILDIIKNREIYDMLRREGFELVKDNATRAIIEKILPAMEGYVIAGSNPVEVARQLERLFGDKNSDWERLARSELSMASEMAKKEEWKAWGISRMEFAPAPDACPICMSMAGDYDIDACPVPVSDTHPRCRCSTRPAQSEVDG